MGGCSVVAIGEGAFRDAAGLTRVVIPDGVTSIGEKAFADCVNLTSVAIPASVVDIPQSAFEGCNKYWASMFRSVGGPQSSIISRNETITLTNAPEILHQ